MLKGVCFYSLDVPASLPLFRVCYGFVLLRLIQCGGGGGVRSVCAGS